MLHCVDPAFVVHTTFFPCLWRGEGVDVDENEEDDKSAEDELPVATEGSNDVSATKWRSSAAERYSQAEAALRQTARVQMRSDTIQVKIGDREGRLIATKLLITAVFWWWMYIDYSTYLFPL